MSIRVPSGNNELNNIYEVNVLNRDEYWKEKNLKESAHILVYGILLIRHGVEIDMTGAINVERQRNYNYGSGAARAEL